MSNRAVSTGLDVLVQQQFKPLEGHRFGLLCNHASIDASAVHVTKRLANVQKAGVLEVVAAFSPEHGLWGMAQDGVKIVGGERDARSGLMVHSLYGENLEPTDAMLEGIDAFIVDIPEVGSRYYTFLWTMAHVLRACERKGIPAFVLDRPNPIGGDKVEGALLEERFASLVGLYPIPMRTGMTIGEVATYVKQRYLPKLSLTVIRMEGWKRSMPFEATGLLWAAPSPNMPTPATALVYPGMCLVEATNISEGRGTTQPFETFGAPFLDGDRLAEDLNDLTLPGVRFRGIQFRPMFSKHADKVCSGCFIHVTDPERFNSVLTSIACIALARKQNRAEFRWTGVNVGLDNERLRIHTLGGCTWLKEMIEAEKLLDEFQARMSSDCREFEVWRKPALLY